MKGYVDDIENATTQNTDFRRVLYTGRHMQLVLMALQPGEEIGSEVHADIDQFFRIEQGAGTVEIDGVRHDDRGRPDTFTVETAGTVHQPFASDTGCIMLAIFDGPIGGYLPDGTLAVVGDARLHYYMAKDNDAVRDT